MHFAVRGSKFFCGSLVIAFAFAVAGCGTKSVPITDVDTGDETIASQADGGSSLKLLAVPGPDDGNKSGKSGPTLLPKGLFGKRTAAQNHPSESEAAPARKETEKGSPEWLLNEIQRIRMLPLPHEVMKEEDESDDSDEEDQPLTPAQEKKLAEEIERTKGIRRERNRQIIKLAEECIQKTNKNPEQEPLFSAAAHNLLDAQLQFALQGDAPSIEALYEAEKVFYQRNPKSDSAKEASLTLVNLTHANALRYGSKEPRWLKEFSKHAQIFATRFPEDFPRSIPLLMAAGRSCENNGKIDEARSCYALLASKFPETPQGQQAAGVIRRLQLKDHELELSGPGIDGNDINVKAHKGKMVLIVFWASNAQPFVQQVPKLVEVTKKYKKFCTVIGVNIDTDERAVESFVEQHQIDWLQIFFPSRSQRGWNSPIATYYGVNSLPTIWLLDPNGIVAETNLDASNLEAKIREVYAPFYKKK